MLMRLFINRKRIFEKMFIYILVIYFSFASNGNDYYYLLRWGWEFVVWPINQTLVSNFGVYESYDIQI